MSEDRELVGTIYRALTPAGRDADYIIAEGSWELVQRCSMGLSGPVRYERRELFAVRTSWEPIEMADA